MVGHTNVNPPTTEFSAEQYESLVPPGFENFYWHRARNRIVERKLRAHVSTSEVLLDIGCGAGVLVAHLRRRGFECDGADLGQPARVIPGAAGHLHLGQDVFALPEQYRRRVTAILLLDVLEHLPDPAAFLRRCDEAFESARLVFLTVPARMEIWSNFDDFNKHYRRYTLEDIRDLEVPPSFALRETGYFFHTLYWAALIHGRLSKRRATTMRTPRFRMLHTAIGMGLDLEDRIVPAASPGSSLYAIFTRSRRAPTGRSG